VEGYSRTSAYDDDEPFSRKRGVEHLPENAGALLCLNPL
jgi:hypothetical protein